MEKYWIFESNVAKCRHCGEEYTEYIDTNNLKRHMGTQHNHHFEDNCLYQYFELQNNMMKCTLCAREYKIQIPRKLRNHLKQHESMIDTDRDKQREQHTRQDYWWIKHCTLENDRAQCRFCDKFYYITIYKYGYENHVAIYHTEIYNKIDKKENWIWQYFALGNNKAMCNICKRYFIVSLASNSIRRHLNAKHEDKIKKKQDDESGQGIHGNAETIMKSLVATLTNDLIQRHNEHLIRLENAE
ncbi:hypothetical protein CAJAP_06287 [Camponotus japonicus]